MHGLSRILLFLGVTFFVAGLVVFGFGLLRPLFGRRPGDLSRRGRSWGVSLPIVSCLLLGGLLSLVLWVVIRLHR